MNLEAQSSVFTCQSYIDLCRIRVPGDVGQGFLKNPENSRGQLLVYFNSLFRQVDTTPRPRTGFKFLGRPLDCRGGGGNGRRASDG